MAILSTEKYSFVSHGLPRETFAVVNFRGVEGLSRCYEFELTLVSEQAELDLRQVLRNPVTFTIRRPEGDLPYHGILSVLEQRQAFQEYVFYRAVLVPKLWWLSLTRHNQVFLNSFMPEVLEAVLKDGGLTTLDFELRFRENYSLWDYMCQYGETHLNFISRWMERRGIYYYFEQATSRERLIITDTSVAHLDMPQGAAMIYSPPSGLDSAHIEEVVHSLICRQQMLPQKVVLKDYNYMTPSLEMTGEAEVIPDGRGQVYIYGEHFRTPEIGHTIAQVRAQELLCREKRFIGESSVPFLRPGYTFTLEKHYRSDFNQKYLTIEVEHQGSQAAYLVAGLQQTLGPIENQPLYRNTFTAIPASVQFRPELKADKPKFHGSLSAKIDAAGAGNYAELDEHGRYKVILPFDLSGRSDGKASAYLRMVQPYAGSDHGMHFPLHKGTEVLLTFIDGDPDRPIIAGAVPNPDTPSPVTVANQSMSMIQTAGQNKIAIEDQEGSQRILMHSPTSNTWVRMGAPNDPPKKGWESFKETGYAINTDGVFEVHVGGVKFEIIVGAACFSIKPIANTFDFTGGASETIILGGKVDVQVPEKWTLATEDTALTTVKTKLDSLVLKVAKNKTKIEGTVQTVTESVTKVATSVTEAKDNVTKLINTKIETVNQSIATANTAITSVSTRVGTVETDIKTANTKIEQTNTAIKDSNTEVKTIISESITQVGTAIVDVGTKITKCELDSRSIGIALQSGGQLISNYDLLMQN